MNLRDAILLVKKNPHYTNERIAQYFGLSRNEIIYMIQGHTNLRIENMKRISNLLRISIDELTDNQFVTPSYHYSEQTFSLNVTAEKNYPEFSIQKGDILYVRPFVHEAKKIGQMVMTLNNKTFTVERYTGNPQRYADSGKQLFYHIVGISRFLTEADDDINVKAKLDLNAHGKPRSKMGRPVKRG